MRLEAMFSSSWPKFILIMTCLGLQLAGCSGANMTGSTKSSGKDKPQDEGRTVPPSDINGAYLDCETANYRETGATVAEYGCNVFKSDKTKLDLQGVVAEWSLANASGPIIEAQPTKNPEYAQSWDVPIGAFRTRLVASVTVSGIVITESSTREFQDCSNVTTNSGQVKVCMSRTNTGSLVLTDYLPSSNYSDIVLKSFEIDGNGQCVNSIVSVGAPNVTRDNGKISLIWSPGRAPTKGELYCISFALPATDPSFAAVLRAVINP